MDSTKVSSTPAERDEPKDNKAQNQPYHAPRFTEYGDIRSITQGGTASTISDSGNNMMSPP